MEKELNSTPVYSMGVAERLTGLTGRQIRYWEQHGLIAPSRTKGRQRLYSESDVARLKEIKRLMGEGMTLERVKSYLMTRDAKARRAAAAEATARLERGPRLTSLYPLNNRAELLRIIDRDDD